MGNSWSKNFHTGVFAGSVTQCSSIDDTWYCKFSRLFSAFMMFLILMVVIYYIYRFASGKLKGKK